MERLVRICWDNLEGFCLTSNGSLVTNGGHTLYVEKDACAVCGDPYLTNKYRPSIFCSKSCSGAGKNNNFYGKKHSLRTKNKIARSKKSQITRGSDSPTWKGGVWRRNLPLYDTYARNLQLVEEVGYRMDKGGIKILTVHCSKCGKIFTPKLTNVKARIKALNNLGFGESRFYCSADCKNSCDVFGKRAVDYLDLSTNQNDYYSANDLRIWSNKVMENANYKCEICGAVAKHAHHIKPKKLEPFLALDPENGLAVCVSCHYKHGHSGDCTIVNIHIKSCNGEDR
jgi:5-methylcytosine-specific restriction endonuclease McrA